MFIPIPSFIKHLIKCEVTNQSKSIVHTVKRTDSFTENVSKSEKWVEMFPQKRKNAQILLKSQLSARGCWKCKILLQIRASAEKVLRAIETGSQI